MKQMVAKEWEKLLNEIKTAEKNTNKMNTMKKIKKEK